MPIGGHEYRNSLSDEWGTPSHILDALKPYDLDPALPGKTNGLDIPWHGFVFLNPPYKQINQWMKKMAEHNNGIALVFARTETNWWHEYVWPIASSILFLRGRLSFIPLSGQHTSSNSGAPSVLIAYGSYANDRLIACSIPGTYVSLESARIIDDGR